MGLLLFKGMKLYDMKGLATGNAHVKYESHTLCGWEAMAKIEVFYFK